jgi:aminotransferase
MISKRVQGFTESVIREMTRVNNQYGGINLAQGMPNFPPPPELLEAAHRAIDGDFHQYAITWGTPRLRRAIADKYRRFYGMELDPELHVTVCCGSTETMLATLLAVLNPGDEVIIFEPFYENYGPGCIIAGAEPVFVPLEPPVWSFDPDRLSRAVSSRTRAVIFNSPNNPSGKVFSRAELQVIADLCIKHDLLAITDEIYEHIVYDGETHTPIATLPGMAERTITISGISKSYSVTGWRVGFAVASPELSVGIRRARLHHGGRASPSGSRGDGARCRFVLRVAARLVPGAPRSLVLQVKDAGSWPGNPRARITSSPTSCIFCPICVPRRP